MAMVGPRALMQLVRIRSKDGQFRITVDAQDDARVLVDKVRRARSRRRSKRCPTPTPTR